MSQTGRIPTGVEAPGYEMGCLECAGVPAYRVKRTHPNPDECFDQLVDHWPLLFTSDVFLTTVAMSSHGSVTVWRLEGRVTDPMKDQIAAAEVIAYAGPDPLTGGRSWRSESNPKGTSL